MPVNIQNNIYDYINSIKWECHICLSFKRIPDASTAIKKSKLFLQRIKHNFPKTSFSALILYTHDDIHREHVHLLLRSVLSYPQIISLIDPDSLLQHWHSGKAEITNWHQWKKGNSTIAGYLTSKKNMNFYDEDSFSIDFFRPKLLQKFQNER